MYVHCQAGAGRALMLIMAFLLIHGEPQFRRGEQGMPFTEFKKFGSYDEALTRVKSVRPHIAANQERREKIEEIVNTYHNGAKQKPTMAQEHVLALAPAT